MAPLVPVTPRPETRYTKDSASLERSFTCFSLVAGVMTGMYDNLEVVIRLAERSARQLSESFTRCRRRSF